MKYFYKKNIYMVFLYVLIATNHAHAFNSGGIEKLCGMILSIPANESIPPYGFISLDFPIKNEPQFFFANTPPRIVSQKFPELSFPAGETKERLMNLLKTEGLASYARSFTYNSGGRPLIPGRLAVKTGILGDLNTGDYVCLTGAEVTTSTAFFPAEPPSFGDPYDLNDDYSGHPDITIEYKSIEVYNIEKQK